VETCRNRQNLTARSPGTGIGFRLRPIFFPGDLHAGDEEDYWNRVDTARGEKRKKEVERKRKEREEKEKSKKPILDEKGVVRTDANMKVQAGQSRVLAEEKNVEGSGTTGQQEDRDGIEASGKKEQSGL